MLAAQGLEQFEKLNNTQRMHLHRAARKRFSIPAGKNRVTVFYHYFMFRDLAIELRIFDAIFQG